MMGMYELPTKLGLTKMNYFKVSQGLGLE